MQLLQLPEGFRDDAEALHEQIVLASARPATVRAAGRVCGARRTTQEGFCGRAVRLISVRRNLLTCHTSAALLAVEGVPADGEEAQLARGGVIGLGHDVQVGADVVQATTSPTCALMIDPERRALRDINGIRKQDIAADISVGRGADSEHNHGDARALRTSAAAASIFFCNASMRSRIGLEVGEVAPKRGRRVLGDQSPGRRRRSWSTCPSSSGRASTRRTRRDGLRPSYAFPCRRCCRSGFIAIVLGRERRRAALRKGVAARSARSRKAQGTNSNLRRAVWREE